ncbi:hypothetical protein [Lentzea sp. NPDC051838]|uniref:hypothetical protein n=1 Tax=Lentzea sp. NPDC051838 TaxID=3154849 RepID=UPI0034266349
MKALKIVASGTYRYTGDTIQRRVAIVLSDHDYWYEYAKAANDLDIGQLPVVDDEGHAFYVSYSNISEGGTFLPDSRTHRTFADAKFDAESRAPSPINWLETP